MKRYCFWVVMVVLISFGCKQRVVTQPEAQPAPHQKEQQKTVAEQPQKSPEKITEQKVASADIKGDSKEMASKGMEEKEGMFKDVLFDYDKYDIKEDFKAVLKSISSWMIKNPDSRLSIEGHCDERGTNEYNLALGDRRAKAAKDFLISLGVPSARLDTLSYGEERPLCTEQTEECWAKNRRAHFVVLDKAGK